MHRLQLLPQLAYESAPPGIPMNQATRSIYTGCDQQTADSVPRRFIALCLKPHSYCATLSYMSGYLISIAASCEETTYKHTRACALPQLTTS